MKHTKIEAATKSEELTKPSLLEWAALAIAASLFAAVVLYLVFHG